MSPELKPVPDGDVWDTGELGRDEKHVRRSPPDREETLDQALDLQMISIRLQKELIEQLKFIANYHGIGYQPLVRDVLCRFARSEMLTIASEMKQQLEAKEAIEDAKQRA
jgi:hypothetical protein